MNPNKRTFSIAIPVVALIAIIAIVAAVSRKAGPQPSLAASSARPSGSVQSRVYLHSYNLASSGIALEGYCPVAYFAANKPIMGKVEHASPYNGVTYHLSSADAKRIFDEDPEKYIPAYGGWCAFGMAVEDKFPVDPTTFKIVDGRLMVFLRNVDIDALELWNTGDESDYTSKADAHWRKVSQ